MDEEPLTRLHPDHVKVSRIGALLLALPFAAAGFALEVAGLLFPGAFIVPVVLVAAWLVMMMPAHRYRSRGYAMGADRLRVVGGILFRKDTVVPFGRVQHIDVEQNPLERWYGLATLTLHTAGTHNASVDLPGLGHETALDLRERIRAHVRRETV